MIFSILKRITRKETILYFISLFRLPIRARFHGCSCQESQESIISNFFARSPLWKVTRINLASTFGRQSFTTANRHSSAEGRVASGAKLAMKLNWYICHDSDLFRISHCRTSRLLIYPVVRRESFSSDQLNNLYSYIDTVLNVICARERKNNILKRMRVKLWQS